MLMYELSLYGTAMDGFKFRSPAKNDLIIRWDMTEGSDIEIKLIRYRFSYD